MNLKQLNPAVQRPVRHEKGFSLVIVLMLMALLTMVGMGLMSLTTISLRTSGQHTSEREARANARLALMLAVSELQKQLGPDQRVTAESAIFDPSSDSSQLKQPHWANVWSTTREDGSPFLVRNGENGGLRDTRTDEAWDAESKRLNSLVSGNESRLNYYDGRSGSELPEDMIRLVGPGTVGDQDGGSTAFVSAPAVNLVDQGNKRGSYAWWVGDLGTKANLATPDRFEEAESDMDALRSLQLAQDASFGALDDQQDLANDQRDKLMSLQQLNLAAPSSSAVSRVSFHDFTTESQGLLVDVREGGLKKDLTAYLESNGSIPALETDSGKLQGLQDLDRLVGPPNDQADALSASPGQAKRYAQVSPTFGLLRDWYRRASQTPFGDHRAEMERTEIAKNQANLTTTSGSAGAAKHLQLGQSDVSPVLVEGSLFYNVSYYDDPTGNPNAPFHLRLHLYPRVALWNPYNFEMKIEPSMILLAINGKKRIKVLGQTGEEYNFEMYWGLTGGAQQGKMFFQMEGHTLKPGETVVWSPLANRPYDDVNFSNNQLSPSASPSPMRSFYQNERTVDGNWLFRAIVQRGEVGRYNDRMKEQPLSWREYVTSMPGGNIQSAGYTQADDYVMVWKPLDGRTSGINLDGFQALPAGLFISCAYQYGDEDEMPVEWSNTNMVPMTKSASNSSAIGDLPDTRTRDGFRLRWLQEPESNRIGSGSLSNTPYLQEAPIATWNLRASYAFRSPFENINDTSPNFFGIYTRDLFDGDVGWSGMMPRYEQGSYRSDPFDQSVRFTSPRILFDVPRRGAEVASLGAFQQVKFSEYIWHPTYAFGNSLADPRIEPIHTEPNRQESINRDMGGWNEDSIGYATDGRSDPNGNAATTVEDNWAYSARSYLNHIARDQNLIYDLSYELNHSLWDGFFLSTGDEADKQAFLKDPQASPLPNGRLQLVGAPDASTASDLIDYHRSASRLAVHGAFNVNSTSVKAWEALLLSSMGRQYGDDRITFPRILSTQGGEWDGQDAKDEEAWTGQRTLARGEIRRLAEEIVAEVKTRGPFLSMSDFVNRRLSEDETGKKGALQAAIDRSGINSAFTSEWPLDNQTSLPDYTHPDHIQDPTRLEQTLKPDTGAWGALGFLTQADLLQFLGPALTVRSDSFVIRAYGSSVDPAGNVLAEAWCEAVVQRTPIPVQPDSLGLNPKVEDGMTDFGRKFEIRSFRWLHKDEV